MTKRSRTRTKRNEKNSSFNKSQSEKKPSFSIFSTPETSFAQNTTDSSTQTETDMSFRMNNPPFDEQNVEAWFMKMDFWFKAIKIKDEQEQFDWILASQGATTLPKLQTVIENAPTSNKVKYIRTEIIALFSDSQQKRLNKLLSAMPLGDQKPSELFQEMKRVAGGSIADSALKGLWAQRLPDHARAAIAASSGTSDEFTKIADAIVEAMQLKTINEIKINYSSNSTSDQSSEMQTLRAEISQLTKLVNERMTQRGRSNSRNRYRGRSSSNRRRSNTPHDNSGNNEECWYHRKFKNDAKHCPCNFKRMASNTNSSA